MKYHLIWFDWGDSYFSECKRENWKHVDYYEDNIKQSDKIKTQVLEEMVKRASHNIWNVVDYRGTAITKELCEEMEYALQNKQDYPIHKGFIRLKENS